MREMTDKELEEGINIYQEAHAFTDYWKVPREVIIALHKELYRDADHVRLYPYMEKKGGPVLLAARASSKTGEPCGSTYNDIRPCPPFCE